MFTVLGFAAQFIALVSITAIVISCIFTPIPPVVAEVIGADATLPIASSYSAKSMASPVYVTTIDESVVSPVDYSALTIRELKALCRERGVKRYGSLRKHELIELLSAL